MGEGQGLDTLLTETSRDEGWKGQRRSGIAAIAVSIAVGLALWLAMRWWAPPVPAMETLGDRMVFALKCCAFATLFCLATGVEAVAHERLQSPAFDPLAGHETRRLRVNQRYLQNTMEQIVVFAVGLFGLAAYSADGAAMRAVEATTLVWVLTRFAFWIGYHKSAAMRGIGAPGMILSLLVLAYVVARAAYDLAGAAGAVGVIGGFLAIEAVLFWTTRDRAAS